MHLNFTMDCFQTVGISRCKDAIELTSRQEVRFFFQNEVKKHFIDMFGVRRS